MEKNLKISILYDFYKLLLTNRQADVIDLYYNKDLSLAEIGEHLNITRQAVRDSIKRGEKILLDLEDKLMLVDKFMFIQSKVSFINKITDKINDINARNFLSKEIDKNLLLIKKVVSDIVEKM